jgi:replicative DNA helicase
MIGKQFLSALLAEGSTSALIEYGDITYMFKGSEVDAYSFVRQFVKQYSKLPELETIEAHTGDALVKHKEPSGYYYDLMEARHIEYALKKAMKESNELLMPGAKDPEAALVKITGAVMQLIAQKHQKQVLDFRHAYDLVVQAYVQKFNTPDGGGLQFGWPTLDTAAGGLRKGDVISFVGRPAAGKTWQMLYGAHFGWAKAGPAVDPDNDQSRLFVSMEMSILPIMQRLAAMQTHLKMSQVQHGGLETGNFKKFKKGLMQIQGYGAPFYVVDGNLTATVEDIAMLVRQLKPAATFIDGGYLVQHPTERDRFRRVAENADLMKKELAPLCPTCVSWQFAKTAAKKDKKKGEKATLEDIGYTDAIAQVSSLVLGVFEEESVETLKQRRIEILKGRSGETGSFLTRWNFNVMDFTETEKEDVTDLQFV